MEGVDTMTVSRSMSDVGQNYFYQPFSHSELMHYKKKQVIVT